MKYRIQAVAAGHKSAEEVPEELTKQDVMDTLNASAADKAADQTEDEE